MNKYLGIWWEIGNRNWTENGMNCSADVDYPTEDPNTHQIVFWHTNWFSSWYKNTWLRPSLTCDKGTGACDMAGPWPISILGNIATGVGGYNILATDYDTYSIVYSCQCAWWTLCLGKDEYLWLMSRQRTIDEDKFQEMYEKTVKIINKANGDENWDKNDKS